MFQVEKIEFLSFGIMMKDCAIILEKVILGQSTEYYFLSFQICISPDQKSIVSVGTEGAIFIWKMPEEVVNAKVDKELPTVSQVLQKDKSQKSASFVSQKSK